MVIQVEYTDSRVLGVFAFDDVIFIYVLQREQLALIY